MGISDRDYMRRDRDENRRKAYRDTQDGETNLLDILHTHKKRIIIGCVIAIVVLAAIFALSGAEM